MHKLPNIKNYTIADLKILVAEAGLPAFRAEQIFRAIYQSRIESFDDVTTLPLELRQLLSQKFGIDSFAKHSERTSKDGAVKFLFGLPDGNSIESVLIPQPSKIDGQVRNTLCISSQAGCSLGCSFCATGTLGLLRNLSTAEIIDQVLLVEKLSGRKVNSIVFMGMGEPLQNYNNVIKAIDIISHEKAGIIGRKRITISTCGIVPIIRKLAEEPQPVRLAISLNATTDEVRSKLMPINDKWPLKILLAAAEEYYKITRVPVTFEYIPFAGVNDSEQDAKRLAKFAKRANSKVNLIPFNDISFIGTENKVELKEIKSTQIGLKSLSDDEMKTFARNIKQCGGKVFIRDSFGSDIEGACGQLALAGGR